MKVIIAGSRDITDFSVVEEAIAQSGFIPTEIVSGGCRGVDRLGEEWARQHNIPIRAFIPKWQELGKGAGHIRNGQMARYADALVAIWDGSSPGTRNMVMLAEKNNLQVFVWRVSPIVP